MDAGKLDAPVSQRGMTIVYVVLSIFVLLAALGLAVDLGHVQVVRGELQNAADAAALAGAKNLYLRPPTPGACTLSWDQGRDGATAFIAQNRSDGTALSDGNVERGYWNPAFDPATDPPLISETTLPANLPVGASTAIKVTVGRQEGKNGGPVPTFFMKDLTDDIKILSVPVSSKPAVAVSGYAGYLPPGSPLPLFPIAIHSCMTDQYFNRPTYPNPPTAISFTGSLPISYPDGGSGCVTGQWTSFLEDPGEGTSAVMSYLDGTKTSPALGLSDQIWTLNASMRNALFQQVKKSLPAGGRDVLLAIVAGDLLNAGRTPILGFATFHIDDADNKPAYVRGHFVDYQVAPPGTRPGGRVSNTVTMPVLVQ